LIKNISAINIEVMVVFEKILSSLFDRMVTDVEEILMVDELGHSY
jgi:hypothetical protein